MGNLSHSGLLSGVDIENPSTAITADAIALRCLLYKRIVVGTAIANVASVMSGSKKSFISLGDGARRKLYL
jgi:hypothetical protein